MTERQDNFNAMMMDHLQQSGVSNGSSVSRFGGAWVGDMEARYRYFFVELPIGSSQKVDV